MVPGTKFFLPLFQPIQPDLSRNEARMKFSFSFSFFKNMNFFTIFLEFFWECSNPS